MSDKIKKTIIQISFNTNEPEIFICWVAKSLINVPGESVSLARYNILETNNHSFDVWENIPISSARERK